MNNNYFIVQNKILYFYDVEKKCIQAKPKKIINRIIWNICLKCNIAFPRFILDEDLFNADKVIMTDYAYNLSLLKTLLNNYNSENIILYYMNIITSKNEYMMKLFLKDNIYTFDKNDSNTYDICFMHTPYSDNIMLTKNKLEIDTLFLGRAKSRINEIISLKHLLDSLGLNNRFLVLDTDTKEIKIDLFMPYYNYLELVSKSKCLIELNQKNQNGCSLRFMESLFLHKKLITNNIHVTEDPYYNENNVYILNNDTRDLKEFINAPYIDDGKCLDDLIFKNWIGKF